MAQWFGQQATGFGFGERRHFEGPGAHQIRRPRRVRQFGDSVAAGKYPSHLSVRLDGFAHRGQQILAEDAFAQGRVRNTVAVVSLYKALAGGWLRYVPNEATAAN